MKPETRRYLNQQPKEFRAKTSKELRELFQLKDPLERQKNISRSKDEAKSLILNSDLLAKMPPVGVYGTADGRGWYNRKDAIGILTNVAMKTSVEFAFFYVTLWNETLKTWVPISELK